MSLSHLAVISVVALVSIALTAAGLPAQIAGRVETAVCQVTAQDCGPARPTAVGSNAPVTPGAAGAPGGVRQPGEPPNSAPGASAAVGKGSEDDESRDYWSCGWFGQDACDMVQGSGKEAKIWFTGIADSACLLHLCSNSGFTNAWKSTFEGVRGWFTDPKGSFLASWDGTTKDIRKDWENGHKGSAVVRAVAKVPATVFGGAFSMLRKFSKHQAGGKHETTEEQEPVEQSDIDASGRLTRVPPPITDGPTLPTIPMRKAYRGEDDGTSKLFRKTRIRYLDAAEREVFRIVAHNGRFYRSNGEPFDTNAQNEGGRDGAIWVMDRYGNLYAAKKTDGLVHSSFLAGEDVASAGELKVVNGELVGIDNQSGHYRSPAQTLKEVVRKLGNAGVQISDDQVTYLNR